MQTSEPLQLSVSMPKSSHHATSVEVELVKFPRHPTRAESGNIDPLLILLFAVMSLMPIWMFVLFILSRWSNAGRDKYENVISNPIQQVTCKECRYFINNDYLKCAVHPSTALTKEVLNCSDYCPKQQQK